MPATSKAQQKFFAICEHSPQHATGKCPDMTQGQMRDYAATPTKGLPYRQSLKEKMTK